MHLNVCTENVMSIGQGILRVKLILGNVLENCIRANSDVIHIHSAQSHFV